MTGKQTHRIAMGMGGDASPKASAFARCGTALAGGLIGLMVALLVQACELAPRETTNAPAATERTMTLPRKAQQNVPTEPPLDQRIPADLKTATFALG